MSERLYLQILTSRLYDNDDNKIYATGNTLLYDDLELDDDDFLDLDCD